MILSAEKENDVYALFLSEINFDGDIVVVKKFQGCDLNVLLEQFVDRRNFKENVEEGLFVSNSSQYNTYKLSPEKLKGRDNWLKFIKDNLVVEIIED